MNYRLKMFGIEAKSIRMKADLTQAAVKKLVGINEDTLRRLEKGMTMPTIETLDLLSLAYRCDMNTVFSKHKITFDQYFEDRLKELLPLMRNLDYETIEREAEDFEKEFERTKRLNGNIIKFKMMQYGEYLKSLSNLQKAFIDKSRDDITKLVGALNQPFNELIKPDTNIQLDKLEIRISVLLSIIYRYRDEFDYSLAFLNLALRSLEERYVEDNDFLYFYFLIISNTMMIHHRLDDFDKLDALYKDSLSVIEHKIGIPTLSSYMLRVGVNKHFLDEKGAIDFINVSLSLLDDIGYEEKSDRFRKSLTKLYKFCEEGLL